MVIQLYDAIKTSLIRLKINKPDAEVVIISYPKCGRTWLRLLVGKALCSHYNLPQEQMIDTYALTAVPGVLRTHFSHDFSSIIGGFAYNRMPSDKSEYAAKKVLFITRDIRDVLVSSYFQATKRTGRFNGPISEFVRSDKYGAKKIVTFYNLWYKNQSVPRAFLHLTYEAMHADPEKALTQTLQFMEMQGFTPELVHEAVEFARFDNMKKLEASGFFKDDKMQPGDQKDGESFKVRKGVVGGYRDYLDDADLAYIGQVITELGCPFLTLSHEQ